jgi:ABC-type dipeptide/oligopeptide/nickel transport system ATPase component
MIRSFFGWERIPFTREVETRHLHRSVRFEECVARLQYMVMTRSIGCVTGEIGCGKSTAIRALKDRLDANKYRFLYLSDANLKPRDFYRELLHHFGLTPSFLRSEAKRQFNTSYGICMKTNKRSPSSSWTRPTCYLETCCRRSASLRYAEIHVMPSRSRRKLSPSFIYLKESTCYRRCSA